MLIVGMTVLAPVGRADESEKTGSKRAAGSSGAADAIANTDMSGRVSGTTTATIDRILERAVQNIAARYNLNDVQTAETDKMMKDGVHSFLREHENEVWPIIHKLLASQLKPPEDRKEMMQIGEAARPLAKLASKAIFAANEEWRLILTPEQRRVHDYDMAEMGKTFEVIDTNFREWERGRASEKSIFPEPQLSGSQPPRPPRPKDGSLPPPEVEVFDPTQIFTTLVEAFIKEYELDEGQITSARSILEEFRRKANDFREAKKEAFAKIAADQQDALINRDREALEKARAANKKLLEPVYELCAEMDGRLKGLLTTAQIQRHADRSKVTEKKPEPRKVTKKTSPKKTADPATESPGKNDSDRAEAQSKSEDG